MEKLIDLINERETERFGDKWEKIGYDTGLDSCHLISKKDGFIQRLVKNDKIETNNLSLKAFKNIFSGGGFVEVSDLEVLLMLLAISDTPINDLISYLK